MPSIGTFLNYFLIKFYCFKSIDILLKQRNDKLYNMSTAHKNRNKTHNQVVSPERKQSFVRAFSRQNKKTSLTQKKE